MLLQFFKFTDIPLQFVFFELCYHNFTTLRNAPLLTPSLCFLKFIDQNTPVFFLLSSPLLRASTLHGAGRSAATPIDQGPSIPRRSWHRPSSELRIEDGGRRAVVVGEHQGLHRADGSTQPQRLAVLGAPR